MSSLKKQLSSGIFYTAIAKYAGVVMSIVITGVLSHLLTPEDFGTVIPVTVIVTFFSILGDVGIGPAVIQYKSLSTRSIDSIFTVTLLLGGFLSILFFSLSWIIAAIYNSDILVPLCQILSLSLFFSCANVVPNALLYRNKQFKYLAFRSLIVQFLSGILAIISAFWGFAFYALVIQSIMSSACMFFISYRKQPLRFILFSIDWSPLKEIFSFLSYQFLFNIFNYFSVNLDKLLINKYLGADFLGYYDKSYKLMQMPLQNIPFVITPVMHPIFSDMQNDLNKMCFYYSKIVRFMAFIGFPLSIFLFFSGSDLIYIIFGDQWGDSVPVFKILALSIGFQFILYTSGSIFQSSGYTKYLFLSGVLSTITIVLAIFIGLFYFKSIESIGLFLLLAFVINFFQTYVIMYCFLFNTTLLLFLRLLVSPLFLSMILACVLFVTESMLHVSIFPSLLIKSFISLIVYCLYIQLTGTYNLSQLVRKYLIKIRTLFLK